MSLYSRLLKIIIYVVCLSTTLAEAATYVRTRSGAGLNVRSLNGRIIGSLPNGAKLRIDPSKPASGKYIYVIFNGRKGRVARSLTTSRGSGEVADQTPGKKRKQSAPDTSYDEEMNTPSSSGGSCGTVFADCKTHRITFTGSVRISSRDSVIDCGYGGRTHSGTGRVGGEHPPRGVKGTVVPPGKGVRIEGVPRMGDAGGGKVFHVKWWDGLPTGENRSKGCIRISPAVLRQLKKCKGAPLKIRGSDGSGTSHNEPKNKRQQNGVK